MGRPVAALVLSAEERAYLERQVRRHRVARSLSERCRIILRCADGFTSKAVGADLGVHEHTVGKWRRRFLKDRIEGLYDEARLGRPRTIDDDRVAAVIEHTLATTPHDATHWSIRWFDGQNKPGFPTPRSGVSGRHSVCSLTAARPSNCQPILCLSTRFATSSGSTCRCRPGAGPVRRRKKPNPSARSRAAGLADDAGHAGATYSQLRSPRHHVAVRRPRHRLRLRHRKVLQAPPGERVPRFLKEIDARLPDHLDVHVVMDNYATDKTPRIRAWLARRPRYHVHFSNRPLGVKHFQQLSTATELMLLTGSVLLFGIPA